MWQVDIQIPMNHATTLLDSLESDFLSGSCFENPDDPKIWIVSFLSDAEPDKQAISNQLASLGKTFSFPLPSFSVTPVVQKDWVTESQNYFSPLTVGKFYIHTSWHDTLSIPKHLHPIAIDPSQAFGTGTHETTQGCLIALSHLADNFTPDTVLDMGTGTGILAIAARYLWPDATIIAADNDPKAVTIAQDNCTAFSVRCLEANRFTHPALATYVPYDLILANILAVPLIDMAPEVREIIHARGRIILSGFYDWQASDVLSAYQKQGFFAVDEQVFNQWGITTLRAS